MIERRQNLAKYIVAFLVTVKKCFSMEFPGLSIAKQSCGKIPLARWKNSYFTKCGKDILSCKKAIFQTHYDVVYGNPLLKKALVYCKTKQNTAIYY